MLTKLLTMLLRVGDPRRLRRSRAPKLALILALALSLAACGPLITRTTRTGAKTGTTTAATSSAGSSTATSSTASLASAHASATPSGSSPSAAQTAAIKRVIENANHEQAEALASGNPALMRDTATASYYAQMAQMQKSLESSGISSIQLVRISWESITLTNPTTARATDIETWNTTVPGGGTLQQANTNVYTLVLKNGAWKIEQDEQPTTTSTPSTTPNPSGSPTPVAPIAPSSPGSIGQSANWAGYAASDGNYTAVSADWKVPPISDTSTSGASASWVGIGGVSSTDLIQAGTEATVENGQVTYTAWYELLPQAQQIIPLEVNAGDQMSVAISQQTGGQWKIVIKDTTSSQSYQTSVSYSSSVSSVEWIEEAPAVGENFVLPLDNFGSVTFTSASTVENGKTRTIAQAGGQTITMENEAGQALAQPSKLSSNGSSFTVTRTTAAAAPSVPGGRHFRRFPDGFSG